MSVKLHEAFSMDSFMDRLLFFDDFHGDQLQDEWNEAGTGSAAVVDAQIGGIVRLTTGALATNAYQIDWGDIRSLHVTKKVSAEYRVKLNQTANMLVLLLLRFAFNDYIGFVYEGINWYIRCRDDGAVTSADSGIAADTDYHIFRIECHTHVANHVHFYIDGVETANSPIATNVPDDAADYLQPWLYIQTTEDVAKSMDVDYCYIRQER